MEKAIKDFPKQFEYEPKIVNEGKWSKYEKFILAGMGGSHLQGEILEAVCPALDMVIHRDYGLPNLPERTLKQTLIIASSYSGNTEETISAFEEAITKGYPVAVTSQGGRLIELAKEHEVPYIQIPDTGIQPRDALGFTFKALAKLVGEEQVLKEATQLSSLLSSMDYKERGKELAKTLKGKIPIVYSSKKNEAVAYNWKIKFNETGKIPAFYNVFPELNHNEIAAYDVTDSTRKLAKNLHFIFLKDEKDHPRIQKRMEVLEKQLEKRGLPVETVDLVGSSPLFKIFSSLLFAVWTAFYTARQYGRDPDPVPIIEEFKKLIS